jgi:hypothetical protein
VIWCLRKEIVVVQLKAELKAELPADFLHPVIVWQNVPDDAFRPFPATDIQQQLQEESSKSLAYMEVPAGMTARLGTTTTPSRM